MEDKTSLNDVNTFISIGVHYGKKVSLNRTLLKSMRLGIWHNISILNVNKIIMSLEFALNFIYDKVSQGKKVLFVGSETSSLEEIECCLVNTNQYYVRKPIGGLLSNWNTFKTTKIRSDLCLKRVLTMKTKRLLEFYYRKANSTISLLTIATKLEQRPGIVVIFHGKRSELAMKDANVAEIPIILIALPNSNNINNNTKCIVPISNNSRRTLSFICKLFLNVCEKADMIWKNVDVLNITNTKNVKRSRIKFNMFKKEYIEDNVSILLSLSNLDVLRKIMNLNLNNIFNLLKQYNKNQSLKMIIRSLKYKILSINENKYWHLVDNIESFKKIIGDLEIILFLTKTRNNIQLYKHVLNHLN
ncbi:30S ribosomal protein S2 [Candidatus Hodgkinia cicadicola]|uniref:Small ribosomal subunit protein uS2 n=1 Tax=Candidatus Hodgkinia cicadicola TaxID=573658 RepID=A0ABX4MFW6_9HYPH|nr:30S ribosomal protein S2 [Candidatus Hodgkinia cicadicola]